MVKEQVALYIGDHTVGYRAIKNNERGVMYKKNNEEIFQPCSTFIQDILTGPCIIVNQGKE